MLPGYQHDDIIQQPCNLQCLAILCPGLRHYTHTYPASTYQLAQHNLLQALLQQSLWAWGALQLVTTQFSSAPISLLTLGLQLCLPFIL